MRHLRADDYRIMPWKNGGGSTTELAIFPESTGLSGAPFMWRVSIADVVADGPFSRFPDYDRHIMVIEGAGMFLDADVHGTIDLTEPFVPASFSGDWGIEGTLVQGPVRDFNLMVARSFGKSALTTEMLVERRLITGNSDVRIAYVLDGEGLANGHVVAAGDTITVDRGEVLEISPLGEGLRLAVCRITPSKRFPRTARGR